MIIIFCLFVYVIITFLTLDLDTTTDIKFHEDNSFWGFGGYTTSSNREATVKDAWLAIIWPFRFLFELIKGILWLFNEFIVFPFLLIGFKYKKTEIYQYLERNL